MTPDKNGLVEVLDLDEKNPRSIKMYPVDVKETFSRGVTLKDGSPRYVLAESHKVEAPAE